MLIHNYEKKIYSQNGEDGIIAFLLIHINPSVKRSLEFGVHDGRQCNTRLLKERGWKTVMLDGSFHKPSYRLYREFITKTNINKLIKKYDCEDISLLSIDIDGQDFYVWKEIDVTPEIVIIEYNRRIPCHKDLVMKEDEKYVWDGKHYYGSGVRPLYLLGRDKGYHLVCSCSNGVNLFFVHDTVFDRLPEEIQSQSGKPCTVFIKQQKIDKRMFVNSGHES